MTIWAKCATPCSYGGQVRNILLIRSPSAYPFVVAESVCSVHVQNKAVV